MQNNNATDLNATDLNDFFDELGLGLLKPMLEKLLSNVSFATMEYGSKKAKGSIQLNFSFEPHPETCQIVVDHKMTYKCPTIKGSRGEEMRGNTAFFVGVGGTLSMDKPKSDWQGQMDMFGGSHD